MCVPNNLSKRRNPFQSPLKPKATIKDWGNSPKMELKSLFFPSLSDIFDLKHESSIFRSFIQPFMWFWKCQAGSSWDSTEPNLFHHGETTSEYATLVL